MAKIEHGFPDQRLIVYPFYVVEQALNNPLITDLVIHSMGYPPKAEGHYTDRALDCGEYPLIYCTKGEGWYVLDEKRYAIPENHSFILPAEKPHQYGLDERSPWYVYWAHFKGEKAKHISDQLQGVIPIGIDDDPRIDDRIIFLDELLNVLEGGTNKATANYVNLSFNHLIASLLYAEAYRETKFSKSRAENTFFISLTTHLMAESLEDKSTLKELISHFGCSESYMYRLLFKETGCAPVNYFLHMKIDRACQLLLYTNTKINRVALRLGFDDPYYLSHILKKIVSTSSKDHRHLLPK